MRPRQTVNFRPFLNIIMTAISAKEMGEIKQKTKGQQYCPFDKIIIAPHVHLNEVIANYA